MDNKEMPHNMSKRDTISAADFNFIKVLGKGSFGKVLLAERRVPMNSMRWSFRVLIYQTLAGQNPFDADDQKSTFKNIKDQKAVFPKHFLQEAMDVLTSFLAKQPNNRLRAGRYARSEVTTHPFFRNID